MAYTIENGADFVEVEVVMDSWIKLVPVTPGMTPVVVLQTPLTIGRHPENVCQLEGENISRHHAVIEFVVAADGVARHRIRDLKSRNGVRLNGEIVEETFLSPGDRLGIGAHEFIVRAG